MKNINVETYDIATQYARRGHPERYLVCGDRSGVICECSLYESAETIKNRLNILRHLRDEFLECIDVEVLPIKIDEKAGFGMMLFKIDIEEWNNRCKPIGKVEDDA